MIDAHAVNDAIGIKPENQCVNAFECLRVLHAKADQLVDIEEAAPVNLVIRDAPPRETIMLTPKQLVQALPAFHAGNVEYRQCRSFDLDLVRWSNRKILVEISHDKLSVGLARYRDFARRQRVPERLSKHRQQDLAVQFGIFALPVDIEISRIRTGGTIVSHSKHHRSYRSRRQSVVVV